MASPVYTDTYAVDPSWVCVMYKSEILGNETTPTRYCLTVMPRGVSKSSSPQFVWDDQGARDEFYKLVVEGMK